MVFIYQGIWLEHGKCWKKAKKLRNWKHGRLRMLNWIWINSKKYKLLRMMILQNMIWTLKNHTNHKRMADILRNLALLEINWVLKLESVKIHLPDLKLVWTKMESFLKNLNFWINQGLHLPLHLWKNRINFGILSEQAQKT